MTKETMETGKNIATNNYIVCLWSGTHYENKRTARDNVFIGQIRNVQTKEQKFFNNTAQMLTYLRKMYVADEKTRAAKLREKKVKDMLGVEK